ncbi:MAG: 2,3,4,5-tetrahydropyridine-2,6-dicarboxylate N-succinyltransferase, partial [Magnetospirillum sp.]
MSFAAIEKTIDAAWEARDGVTLQTRGEIRDAVEAALEALDGGKLRVAEKKDGAWTVNQWLKKAVLLSFRLNDMAVMSGGANGSTWFDKVPMKFEGWDDARFRTAGFRALPGCVVRRSAYIAPGAVLLPCFVNLGAFVDSG